MKELPFDAYDFFGYIACGIVVMLVGQTIWGFPHLLGTTLTFFDTVAGILATYIAGQLIAGPASWVLESMFARKVLGTPTKILLGQANTRILRLIFPEYYTELPESVIRKIEVALAPLTLASPSEDIFLAIRYDKMVLKNDALLSRLNTFRDKYGFNRNVAFSLICASANFLVVKTFFGGNIPKNYVIATFASGLLLVYRYLKFYRQYSYELFNQFARICEAE